MTNKNLRNIFLWATRGLGMGVLLVVLEWIFAYCLPDVPIFRAILTALALASAPASHLLLFFMPDGNLIALFVLRYMFIIIQWTLLGSAIGYWKYRKQNEKPQQGGPGYPPQGVGSPDP